MFKTMPLRKEVKVVEQTETPQSSSSTSRSTGKLHEDFSVPPIERFESQEKTDAQGIPIRCYELYYAYDSDDKYDYSLKVIPLKKHLRSHPFHPDHKLTLQSSNGTERDSLLCCACGGEMPRDRGYYCHESKCGFKMHVECASLAPTITNEHLPDYYQHRHPLCFFQAINYIFDSKWICSACGEILGDIFVRCVLCNLSLHLRCNQFHQLPSSISFAKTHIKHSATFRLARYYDSHFEISPRCIVCNRQVWLNTHFYRTKKMHFLNYLINNFFYPREIKNFTSYLQDVPQPWLFESAHLGCALQACATFKIQLKMKKRIPHPTHKEHHLYLHDHLDDDEDQTTHRCSGCKQSISNTMPTYGCKACEFYLDQSCLQLDERIKHPFHSSHPDLYLRFASSVSSCSACSHIIAGLMYKCSHCDEFALHPQCALVFKNFRLPDTIDNPDCHFHPLKLNPRLVQDDMGEEDQSYCDACEKPRDRDDCLYYCHICKFEVHIQCVISEVVRLREQKEHGMIKLVRASDILATEKSKRESEEARSAEEAKVKNGLTLKQIILCCEDDVAINEVCKELEAITWDSTFGKISSTFDDSKNLLYSDDAIIKFTSKLNSKSNFNFTVEETKRLVFELPKRQYGGEHVVDVGEHQVTLNFATILEGLFAKHGDFCAGCALSPKMKICFCVVFCEVVHQMCGTSVNDVKEDLLVEWWVRLAIVKSAGFRIQFAFKNYKRVVCAYFGFRADKEADKTMTEVRKEFHELPERLKKLRIDLKEGEKRLEELKNKEKKLKEAIRAKKSHLMRECLFEIEEIICDSAGVDLL